MFDDTKTVAGNGSYESDAFTPTEPGTYRWVSSYAGDANNESRSGACGDSAQSVTVHAKPPRIEIESVELNSGSGTAILTVSTNRAGAVRIVETKRIRGTDPVDVDADQNIQLKVRASGRSARQLRRRGELEVNPRAVLETPDANKTGVRQRLELRLKR